MVAKGSRDRLPAGWTVQFKVQKTGRRIRLYKNLETGKSFFSKHEFVNYVKSNPSNKPLPAHKEGETSPVQPVVQGSEQPEWLPDGWNMELKTRMSGPKIGSVYKCYSHPSTGSRFYSKPEVLRHLRTVKREPCTSRQREKRDSVPPTSKVMAEQYKEDDLPLGWIKEVKISRKSSGQRKEWLYKNLETGKSFFSKHELVNVKSNPNNKPLPAHKEEETSPVQPVVQASEQPEWLPDGWNMELRTRMSGPKIGTVYKCYSDPSTGSKFYSKPEVLRHLRNVKYKPCTSRQREKRERAPSTSKVMAEQYKGDDLPPGWIKEVKISRKSSGKRKDWYYTDPTTGYVFRSRKDVFHYLQTGEICKHAYKSKKWGSDNLGLTHDKRSAPSTAKRQKLEAPLDAKKSANDDPSSGLPKSEQSEKNKGRRVSPRNVSVSTEIVHDKCMPEKVTKFSMENKEEGDPSSGLWLPKAKHSESNISRRVSLRNVSVSIAAEDGFSQKKNSEIVQETPEKVSESNKSRRVSPRNVSLSTVPGSQKKKSSSTAEVVEEKPKADHVERNTSQRVSPRNVSVSTVPDDHSQKKNSSKAEIVQEKLKAEYSDGNTNRRVSARNVSVSTSEDFSSKKNSSTAKIVQNVGPSEKVNEEDEIPESKKGKKESPQSVTTGLADDLLQKKNSLESKPESNNISSKRTRSSKPKNQKDLSLPCRSSKRLAVFGLQSQPNPDSDEPSQVPKQTVSSSGQFLDKPCEQFVDRLTVNIDNTSKPISIPLDESPSKEKEKIPLESIDPLEERRPSMEAEKMEPIAVPFADFLSDPCLEFAIKTLTGALPMENATTTTTTQIEPVISTSAPDNLVDHDHGPQNCICKNIQAASKRMGKKKEPGLPRRQPTKKPSERTGGPKLGPKFGSDSSSWAHQSYLNPNRMLSFGFADTTSHGEPSYSYYSSELGTTGLFTTVPHEPSKKMEEKNFPNGAVSIDQRQEQEQQTLFQTKNDNEKLNSHVPFLFGDAWSDPCLDFAFKTLTGAIPVEDSFGIDKYYQERQLNNSHNHRDTSSTLPDYGPPGFCLNDISAHFDGPEKSLFQPVVINNANLPSFNRVSTQQACLNSKDFQGRLKP